MKVRNLLSDDEFITRKEKLNNEIAVAKVSLSESQIEDFDLENTINYALKFISDLPRQWFDMSPELKRRFQNSVFPVGISYKRGIGFGTTKLGLIYEIFEQSKGSKSHLVRLAGATWNQIIEELRTWEQIRTVDFSFEKI